MMEYCVLMLFYIERFHNTHIFVPSFIEDCVCDIDNYCCDVYWDTACVKLATESQFCNITCTGTRICCELFSSVDSRLFILVCIQRVFTEAGWINDTSTVVLTFEYCMQKNARWKNAKWDFAPEIL